MRMNTTGGIGARRRLSPRQKEILLLSALALLLAAIVFHRFFFGEYLFLFNDANDDTFQSYLPSYQLVVTMLRGGRFSLYTTQAGLGASLLAFQPVVFDPFAVPVYLTGLVAGVDAMPYALAAAQALRVLCAALAFRYFLTNFPLSPFARCTAALCYGFSAFVVGEIGEHYMFATAPVFLALMLALLEKSEQKPKRLLLFALVTAVSLAWSLYHGYMLLLACGIFCVLRFFQQPTLSPAGATRWFLPRLGAVLVGVALSGAMLLPSAMLLMQTGRVSAGEEAALALRDLLLPITWPENKITLGKLFSDNLEGLGQFNAAHIFCSALAPIGLAQYVVGLCKRPIRRPQAITLGFLVLCLLSGITRLTGFVFNAFSGYMLRYTFVLIPGLAYAAAWMLDAAIRRKSFHKWVGWGVALAGTALIASVCAWDNPGAAINGAAAILSLVGCTALLHLITVTAAQRQKILVGFLVALVGAGVCVEYGVSLTQGRLPVTKAWYAEYGYETGIQAAAESWDAGGDAFFRTDRNYLAWGVQPAYTYAYKGEYRGVSFYNSTVPKTLRQFRTAVFDKLHISNAAAYSFNEMGTAFDDVYADLLGLRYVVSDYETQNPAWAPAGQWASATGTKYGYENISMETAGILFTGQYSPADFEGMSRLQREAMLSQGVLLDEVAPGLAAAETPAPYPLPEALLWEDVSSVQSGEGALEGNTLRALAGENPAQFNLPVDTAQMNQPEQQVWLQMEVSSETGGEIKIRCDTGFGFSEVYWAGKTTLLGPGESGTWVCKLPADTRGLQFSVTGETTLADIRLAALDGYAYTQQGVSLQNPRMAGTVTGTVETREDSILLLPLCSEAGWRAYIDGQEVPLYTADLAFMAVKIPAGRHEVRFTYTAPGLGAGLALTVAGGLGLAVWVAVLFRRRAVAETKTGGKKKSCEG